ncbi:hypothetical protein B0H14DRAFT_2940865 [Mycena olivaceomarginata]|nr:hypothetical protein B0H14DRAFT_2940865 [Mycena olivaceomarginata]
MCGWLRLWQVHWRHRRLALLPRSRPSLLGCSWRGWMTGYPCGSGGWWERHRNARLESFSAGRMVACGFSEWRPTRFKSRRGRHRRMPQAKYIVLRTHSCPRRRRIHVRGSLDFCAYSAKTMTWRCAGVLVPRQARKATRQDRIGSVRGGTVTVVE